MLLRAARRSGHPSVRQMVQQEPVSLWQAFKRHCAGTWWLGWFVRRWPVRTTGLTSSEISELAAFEWLEPDPGTRIDVGFARMLALVYNRTRGNNDRAKGWQEFMPEWGPRDEEKHAKKVNQQFELMRQIARVKRQGKNG